ncbi:hypothetical protein C8R43DRAFT_1241549 [Mycena crocata]|nr:hypothetical protein C8R43DRAFT_1241549 [Mycena crocata]
MLTAKLVFLATSCALGVLASPVPSGETAAVDILNRPGHGAWRRAEEAHGISVDVGNGIQPSVWLEGRQMKEDKLHILDKLNGSPAGPKWE